MLTHSVLTTVTDGGSPGTDRECRHDSIQLARVPVPARRLQNIKRIHILLGHKARSTHGESSLTGQNAPGALRHPSHHLSTSSETGPCGLKVRVPVPARHTSDRVAHHRRLLIQSARTPETCMFLNRRRRTSRRRSTTLTTSTRGRLSRTRQSRTDGPPCSTSRRVGRFA